VEAEFLALLAPIAEETGCSIDLELRLVRGAYSIDPEHALSLALRAGYRDVTGTALPLTGIKVVADGAVFQGEANIPTVYHGPAGSGAHGDVESVPVAELVRATRVYLRLLARLWA
jgi:acetylornithine deacetylase/succinyl-diaminopimelate desuccinylase-like protein